jgi:transcription elongation GreA/GreB family factor
MDSGQLAAFKGKLHAHCRALLEAKIRELTRLQTDLLAGAADDSKSSAGDKHETARAMMQLEQEKLAGQLQEVEAQLAQLHRLDPQQTDPVVRPGSLVVTDRMMVYLLVGLGKVSLEGRDCYCLSPASPMGQQLIGQQAGATCTVNGSAYRLLSIQ